jgi:hypothetical protein
MYITKFDGFMRILEQVLQPNPIGMDLGIDVAYEFLEHVLISCLWMNLGHPGWGYWTEGHRKWVGEWVRNFAIIFVR